MQDKILVSVVGLGLVIAFSISSAARTDPGPQQDFIRLEQRMNQLEQRFYSIESTLRSLEQQTRLGGGASRGLSQDEVTRLYSQLQTLQLRLADYECALAKLDERTLTPAIREARRKSGASAGDRCRVNPETPLRLP